MLLTEVHQQQVVLYCVSSEDVDVLLVVYLTALLWQQLHQNALMPFLIWKGKYNSAGHIVMVRQ